MSSVRVVRVRVLALRLQADGPDPQGGSRQSQPREGHEGRRQARQARQAQRGAGGGRQRGQPGNAFLTKWLY